jgi:hypothetical protein
MFLGYNFSTMKRYWPLVVIVLMLAAVIGMSQYADSAKHRYEESARQAKAAPIAKNNDGNTAKNANDAYKPPVWAKFVTWPEGVGAWALILTLLAIAWQSIETSKSADAAIDGNRAWILAELVWFLEKPQRYQTEAYSVGQSEPIHTITANVQLICKNEGRCPVWVDSIYAGIELVEGASKLARDKNLQSYSILPPMGAGIGSTTQLYLKCPGRRVNWDENLSILVIIKYHDVFGVKGTTGLGYRITSDGILFRQEGVPERNYNT